jgi:hypothetical protein
MIPVTFTNAGIRVHQAMHPVLHEGSEDKCQNKTDDWANQLFFLTRSTNELSDNLLISILSL